MHRSCALGVLLLLSPPEGNAANDGAPTVPVPTPGSVALLAYGRVGPEQVAALRTALASGRADTRATAARVARVQGAVGLVPTLVDTLSAEADPRAAREEMHALGALAGPVAHEALFGAARRFDGALNEALAESVALRGPAALDVAPRLAELGLHQDSWRRYFDWATGGARVETEKAAQVARELAAPGAWPALLELTERTGRPLPGRALARAVRDDDPRVREETYWHLLLLRDQDQALGQETQAALALTPEAAAAGPGDSISELAFELLGRALGAKPVERTQLLRGMTRETLARIPVERAVLSRLTKPERQYLGEARFGSRDWVDEQLDAKPIQARHELPGGRRIRTASDLPPGVVADLLAVTGCQPPRKVVWNGLEARFDEQATLATVGLYEYNGPPSCQKATRALLLMSVLPSDRPPLPGQTDMIVLPLGEELAGCVDDAQAWLQPLHAASDAPPEPGELREPPEGGQLRAPRKVRSVPPSYPPDARREGRSETVLLEAIIGTSGCVRSVEVIASRQLDFAGEAIRAVAQWRYTPTLLRGQPVPVIMTITVNFRLN